MTADPVRVHNYLDAGDTNADAGRHPRARRAWSRTGPTSS